MCGTKICACLWSEHTETWEYPVSPAVLSSVLLVPVSHTPLKLISVESIWAPLTRYSTSDKTVSQKTSHPSISIRRGPIFFMLASFLHSIQCASTAQPQLISVLSLNI